MPLFFLRLHFSCIQFDLSRLAGRGRGVQGSPRGGGMMRGQGVQRGRGSPARMNIPMGRGRGVQPQPVQTRVPPRKNRNAPSQVKFILTSHHANST